MFNDLHQNTQSKYEFEHRTKVYLHLFYIRLLQVVILNLVSFLGEASLLARCRPQPAMVPCQLRHCFEGGHVEIRPNRVHAIREASQQP